MTNSTKHATPRDTGARHFDVIISGGGLSGALMALSLANLVNPQNTSLNIAIIEANPVLSESSGSFDERVLALSHGSAAYLAEVGAWQYLADYAEPINNIHISDRGHYGKARLYAKQHQVEALGYVAQMSGIGAAMLTALAAKQNISWFSPDTIADIQWQSEQVNIRLTSGQQLSAALLLACDGAQSVCRKFANIATSSRDYQQSALIANVVTEKHHGNIAYERFTDTGPIAMLPLPAVSSAGQKQKVPQGAGHCSLVWTLTPTQAEQMQQLNDHDFAQQLSQAFGYWLGNIKHVGQRVVYPLKLVQAHEQVFHRMALIGNASHTIHPIAGQGFNLGLRDVSAMTALIKQALVQQQDIGAFKHLMHYAQQRQQDQQQVITLTDSLVTLFSNQLPPLVVGRNIGLKVLNYLPVLKNALVKKTMGY
ncbi:2-octaprenyl-6-methoxyphenol hydroxylase [Colwellia chukchiensis]|uniref:2-octaprenyl-6-methoxyphenol hydroxylase n=1 Tax=Colwellia chukchiensis TaxID=641665 RepID=A0A1H7S3R7_9GAMM|nr:2-octaprenyl-6-methoxyphenyl hydroxylase [Colwellia chukchiensis]SEL66929.1 2-octaprenyl-6-methoxyphenol hydroxylase [Colwellia chukchiensis]